MPGQDNGTVRRRWQYGRRCCQGSGLGRSGSQTPRRGNRRSWVVTTDVLASPKGSVARATSCPVTKRTLLAGRSEKPMSQRLGGEPGDGRFGSHFPIKFSAPEGFLSNCARPGPSGVRHLCRAARANPKDLLDAEAHYCRRNLDHRCAANADARSAAQGDAPAPAAYGPRSVAHEAEVQPDTDRLAGVLVRPNRACQGSVEEARSSRTARGQEGQGGGGCRIGW